MNVRPRTGVDDACANLMCAAVMKLTWDKVGEILPTRTAVGGGKVCLGRATRRAIDVKVNGEGLIGRIRILCRAFGKSGFPDNLTQ